MLPRWWRRWRIRRGPDPALSEERVSVAYWDPRTAALHQRLDSTETLVQHGWLTVSVDPSTGRAWMVVPSEHDVALFSYELVPVTPDQLDRARADPETLLQIMRLRPLGPRRP